MNKRTLTGLALSAMLTGGLVTGCSQAEESADHSSHAEQTTHDHSTMENNASHDMEHPMDGGPAPEGITDATDPKYPVGTDVRLTADHMEGMDGAKATIVGAFNTYTYSVNYDPTDGGARVEDHRWVVQEELENAGDQRLADGTPVTILADHMAGMKGAKGDIAYSTDETVYMVDYQADGMTMKNHKWVVESEIEPLD